MKKIYIDVTQLYKWQGKVTGIQRVMYEISNRFRGNDSFEPVFVMWHRNTASFYDLDFEQIVTTLQNSEKDTGKSQQNKQGVNYSALFKRIYHHVPLSRTMYRVFSYGRGRALRTLVPSKIVSMEPGSILFMPHGGVWESHTYISEILLLKKLKQIKLVPILFDMCPVISPQFVVKPVQEAFDNYMRQILPESDLVLAISKNTASDAKTWLASIGSKDDINIQVFRLGDEIGGESQESIDSLGNFILCVGTIEARKNHAGLYYAYKLAKEQDKSLPQIVIVGRKGWMSGDTYSLMTSDPDVKDKFVFLHNTNDSQLAWLYSNAMFTIYPSFYEGWGLPIAESLLRGTPCIASDTSSMKEIAGDLIDYFSPFSSDQIKDKIDLYGNSAEELAALRKRSGRYKITTWDMSFDQVTKEIKKLY